MATLRLGSRGSEVKELQLKLQSSGYNPGTADGIFGMKTMQTVIQFQQDNGLTPDGVVGPITRQALQSKDQGFQMYTVQSGDTFYKIALRFNLVVTALIASNPGVDIGNLRIGQQIRIPRLQGKPVLTRSVEGLGTLLATNSVLSISAKQPLHFS